MVRSQSGFDSTLPEGSASSRPVPDFHFHTEVILLPSDGGQSVFVERPEVCSSIRFSADGGPSPLLPKKYWRGFRPWQARLQIRSPKVASLVRFPPDGFQAETFPPSRSLQQRLSRRTVTATSPDKTQSLVIP
jgi:hypothetical protein